MRSSLKMGIPSSSSGGGYPTSGGSGDSYPNRPTPPQSVPIKESLSTLYQKLDVLNGKVENFETHLFPDGKEDPGTVSTPPPYHFGELVERLHSLVGRVEDRLDKIRDRF